ncbi:hypothetical protein GBAR_LOCUS18252 [Geodia barretti]|uniref:Uncharacterized protein n=1 Tax=Geodia barretti TaxID=519541 RepID=A0AA35SMQ4_GEOBA|nr:hypothetical protein GBAR_LOCUS18252 [Geodia barretti]
MSASVLLFAPVLLLVAGCYADPHVAVHGVLSHAAGHHSVEKRQAVADLGPEKIQCVSNKVNEAFGDGSEEASRCQKAADDDFMGDNNALQATINDGFEIFCAPECGTVVLNAHKECGTFDMMSGATDFLVGLCATNKNGGKCTPAPLVSSSLQKHPAITRSLRGHKRVTQTVNLSYSQQLQTRVAV